MYRGINALSIDLEDWYHATVIRKNKNNSEIIRIRESTEILLRLLNKYRTKATFFIVGEVAERNPELIREIFNNGHEISAHGFTHKMLYELGEYGFRKELELFKRTIHNILGDINIKGFRAPSFSLNENTCWMVDILKEFKFKYDSSIFPIKINKFCGINNAPLSAYGLSKNIRVSDKESSLKEFPVTVWEICKLKLPITGGFFLRLIPIYLQKKGLKSINNHRPLNIYIHPWECDLYSAKVKLNFLSSFRFYYNRKSTLAKLEEILDNFNFDRIDNILGV